MNSTTTANPIKVYELAKELGVDSFSLLDKLAELHIKVKNHMSDLGDGDVATVRAAFVPKSDAKGAKKTATKTVSRTPKSASATLAAKVAAVSKSGPAATAEALTKSPSKITKKRAAPPAEADLAASNTDEKKSPIIRRRTKTAEDGAEIKSSVIVGGSTEQSELDASASTEGQLSAGDENFQQEQYQEGADSAGSATMDTSSATQEQPTPSSPISEPYNFNRPKSPERKSFLKIVEAKAPPPKPIIKAAPAKTDASKGPAKAGQTTQDKDGFRIIRMTKENLDQMAEEEAQRKRLGAKEAEIRPEDVKFADYRKKEMVFLPKRKKLPVGKEIRKTQITQAKAIKRVVEMQDTISVQEFASQMNIKANEVIKKLMSMGQMATINQSIDFDTATLVGTELGFEVKNVAFKEEELIQKTTDTAEELKSRPPVVTVMGHVDHGKTSLLDAIRNANVAAGEAGGITQHIGTYTVDHNGQKITFIDTPGHEAFTSMRARGANTTDIVILVVAADDGVMPQTREALSHAQAAGVPIIVAVNKIDKPGANPDKIKQGLAELNLLSEDWGGQTMFIPVSAIKKTNIDKLLEAILLQSEVLDLKANPEGQAQGVVLEGRLEKGRGPVVTVLVKRGTLKVGDAIVAATAVGRVKNLIDDKGRAVKEIGPGLGAEVLGFDHVPSAGISFDSPKTEADARMIAENRVDKNRAQSAAAGSGAPRMTLEQLFAKVETGQAKELSVILKGDVFGSVEAIKESLIGKVSTEKVKVKVILAATGGITESDVLLASASNAIILGFNVRPETKARQIAEAEHIEIKCYSIIYELLDDVKLAMTGLLDKKKIETFLGRAQVRQTFTVPKIGTIAGSSVIDGKIVRGAEIRLLRDSRIIYQGKMTSLKRFKDDAKEVATGFECGIGLENYNDIKEGDIIEAFDIELVTPDL